MRKSLKSVIIIGLILSFSQVAVKIHGQVSEIIPLPEHPRPDFQRELWQNLNGTWDFRFDPQNLGEKENW